MQKKLTITVDESVYRGLHLFIGKGRISQFIEALVRPHVIPSELDSEYADMAKDKRREKDAMEWSESLIGDLDHESS